MLKVKASCAILTYVQSYSEDLIGIIQNLELLPVFLNQIFLLSPNDSPSKTMGSVFYFI